VTAASDREEAVALFREAIPTTHMHSDAVVLVDALHALGWRKMPSRETLIRFLASKSESAENIERYYSAMEAAFGDQADALIALIDGGSDE